MIADCADLGIVPMSFLDAPAEQGYRPARSAQSERPHTRPSRTEMRNRELTCEETHCWPEGEPHPCQRFHFNTVAEDRVAASSPARGIAPRRRTEPGTRTGLCRCRERNLPLRNACRVKVGTIRRSAQSALCRRRHNAEHVRDRHEAHVPLSRRRLPIAERPSGRALERARAQSARSSRF